VRIGDFGHAAVISARVRSAAMA